LLAGQGDQESSVLAVGQKKGPIIVPASLILVRRSLIAICTLAATRSRGESATTPPEFWMDDGVWRPQQQPAPQTPDPAPQTGYGRTVKLGRSLGGFLNEHWVRFQNLAAEGVHVEITSDCMSACGGLNSPCFYRYRWSVDLPNGEASGVLNLTARHIG
jgi:hypothetical protein